LVDPPPSGSIAQAHAVKVRALELRIRVSRFQTNFQGVEDDRA
jgi:hypothetical protein